MESNTKRARNVIQIQPRPEQSRVLIQGNKRCVYMLDVTKYVPISGAWRATEHSIWTIFDGCMHKILYPVYKAVLSINKTVFFSPLKPPTVFKTAVLSANFYAIYYQKYLLLPLRQIFYAYPGTLHHGWRHGLYHNGFILGLRLKMDWDSSHFLFFGFSPEGIHIPYEYTTGDFSLRNWRPLSLVPRV